MTNRVELKSAFAELTPGFREFSIDFPMGLW